MTVPAVATAHRLDEYLQASRVTLDRDRIALEIDLTPGASVAAATITLLDLDGDGTISSAEAGAYGASVLKDLVVTLDRQPVVMSLTRAEVPSIAEMYEGLGTIRLTAAGQIPSLRAGRRHLDFRNAHEPIPSVYLANAMMPDDEAVAVIKQSRDPRQQELRVDYAVAPGWRGRVSWLAFGAGALSVLAALRWRSSRLRPHQSRDD
jgi:hypothetical protein